VKRLPPDTDAPRIEKTAIATPFGLFEFLRMTFGLWNAENTFQRQMDCFLAGLHFVFVYLDDIIIESRSACGTCQPCSNCYRQQGCSSIRRSVFSE
jgi:hypothetical protein